MQCSEDSLPPPSCTTSPAGIASPLRLTLLTINLVALIAGVTLFIPNIYSLMVSRIMQGVCVGVYSFFAPLMVREYAPLELSGIMGSLPGFMINIGILFAYILTYALKKITGDLTCE